MKCGLIYWEEIISGWVIKFLFVDVIVVCCIYVIVIDNFNGFFKVLEDLFFDEYLWIFIKLVYYGCYVV